MTDDVILTFDLRKRTALHEAAHAVAARAYGIPVNFAEVAAVINDLWSPLGKVSYPTSGPAWGLRAWAETVISLAGPCAEVVFYGGHEGSGHDFWQADRYSRRFDLKGSGKVRREAWTAALKVVRDNRTVISFLASTLRHKGKLSGAQIDGIISSIGKIRPGPLPVRGMFFASARKDAARRRARGDHDGADFIEKWIEAQR